jgi:anti-sigma factor RsiW
MVHEEYKEMIPARALSALDTAEAQALNEHLENCAECQKELEEWQATAAALALTPNAVEPSPAVRERILGEVRKDLSTAEVIPFRSTSRNIWARWRRSCCSRL